MRDDYAIVVGISRYPGFGETRAQARDLVAPDEDATLVKEWLAEPGGGDVPAENIRLIRSRDFPPANSHRTAQPAQEAIRGAFGELQDKALDKHDRKEGLRVGRRLYVYMSGHGFAPEPSRGGLFTANATKWQTHNVYASAYLEWFREVGCFDEFVLWMDCCMDRELSVLPEAIPFRKMSMGSAPGPTFIAFAAQRPLRTVEREIVEDGGRVHGVFTWALLQGLRGVASVDGKISARSLADCLRNTMKLYLAPQDLTHQDIAKEPDIVRDDPNMILAEVKASSIDVGLVFPPAAVGHDVRIWGGAPAKLVSSSKLQATHLSLSLDAGLYVVDVPGAGLRHGFEVLAADRTRAVEITEHGPEVVEGAGKDFTVRMLGDDVTAEIIVVDPNLALVERARARLDRTLAYGIYKFIIRAGGAEVARTLLVDRNMLDVSMARPSPLAAAPLEATAVTHEYHVAARNDMRSSAVVTAGDGAEIFLMARTWTPDQSGSRLPPPWEGVELYDEDGRLVANLAVHGHRRWDGDPLAACNVRLDPGVYFLRQARRNGALEQAVYAVKEWRTGVYLLARPKVDARPRRARPGSVAFSVSLSILMERLDRPSDPFFDRTIEAATLALGQERRILNDELDILLTRKFENPIAGMIGAHLFLLDAERAHAASGISGIVGQRLDVIVPNLRELVGDAQPDVEALSLRCADERLRTREEVTRPPMFAQSWRTLVQASAEERIRISNALSDRVVASTALAPFFVWSHGRSRSNYLSGLKAMARESIESVDADVMASQIDESVETDLTPPVNTMPGFLETFNQPRRPKERPSIETLGDVTLERSRQLRIPKSYMEHLFQRELRRSRR